MVQNDWAQPWSWEMVYQHGLGLPGNHQHLLQKACFSLLGLSQLCNQDASLFGLSFLTFGEELVLLEMLCPSLQMLLQGHQLGCIMPELRSKFLLEYIEPMYRGPCIGTIYPTLLGFGGIDHIIPKTNWTKAVEHFLLDYFCSAHLAPM